MIGEVKTPNQNCGSESVRYDGQSCGGGKEKEELLVESNDRFGSVGILYLALPSQSEAIDRKLSSVFLELSSFHCSDHFDLK